MKYILPITIFFFSLMSCSDSNSITTEEIENHSGEEANIKHPGQKLLETNCYTCHGPSSGMKERVAPPMIAIKAHYIDSETKFEDFSKEFLAFLKNPNEENAKMHGAVRKFRVMPKQNFKEEDLRLIAEFLFTYKIDEPEWFKEHWKEKHDPYFNEGKEVFSSKSEKNLKDTGLEYAMTTKKILGKNLMQQIQQNGTGEALSFCNEKALPLTDSMSNHFNIEIKRVSDKNRNPQNKANDEEISIIEKYKKTLKSNEKIEPILKASGDYSQFYYPIITNSMCIQCHGVPNQDISSEVSKKLTQLYPNDKATGYDINQVRGIWSIKMKEKWNFQN